MSNEDIVSPVVLTHGQIVGSKRRFLNFRTIGIWGQIILCWGFPGGSVVKNLPATAGDVGSIPGLGRSPGEGSGKLLQHSCLGNAMDRGSWQATVRGGHKRVGYNLATNPSLSSNPLLESCYVYSIPGLYPVDAKNNSPWVVTTQNVFKTSPNTPWGIKMFLIETHWSKVMMDVTAL